MANTIILKIENMRGFIILLSLFNLQALLSQNINDDYKEFKSISNKIEELKSLNIQDIMVISDETNNGIIIWRSKSKIKALKFYEYCRKVKKVRLNSDEKALFEKSLQNYDNITKIENVNCDEKVNTFYKLNVKIILGGKLKALNRFYSHCGTEKQRRNSIISLLELHYGLR